MSGAGILFLVFASIVGLLALFGLIGAGGAAGRWIAEWRGHTIEVRNYFFREEIWVDGQKIASGFHSTTGVDAAIEASFEDPVEGSVPVRVYIYPQTMFKMDCGIEVNGELIRQGGRGTALAPPHPAAGRLLEGNAPAEAPAPARQLEDADPRWSAARVLLRQIDALAADDAHARQISGELAERIRGAVAARGDAAEAAEAHAALGGAAEAEALVARREAALERLFEALRALHLALDQRADGPADLSDVEGLLARVEAEAEAEAEVDEALERRRRAARRGKLKG